LAPLQRVDVAPSIKTGVPTVGVMVTVWVAVLGPLQPAALAVIIVVPLQPAAKVTFPVELLMILPPEMLGPSRL